MEIGIWDLDIVCYLEFGIWNLSPINIFDLEFSFVSGLFIMIP